MVRTLATSEIAVKRRDRSAGGRPERGGAVITPSRGALDDPGPTARVLRWLEASGPRWVDLLAELTSIESHSSQRDGVHRVGRLVSDLLAEGGSTVRRVAPPPLDPELRWLADVLAPQVAYEELADTFVADRPGSGPDRVLLLGDIDTA